MSAALLFGFREMPPPSTPTRGLRPSILDRLIDPESAGTSILIGYNVEQMYASVMRDLDDLLNTLHTSHDVPTTFPETRDSIVMYGLPDMASVQAISAEQRMGIGKAIKRAVERYEPRLKQVKVTLLEKQEDLLRMSIRFRIDARLNADPSPDVAFDTILEMGSGKYQVNAADQNV
jgi:type VI secretion system protein ImpF